jgi:hypothetical protein
MSLFQQKITRHTKSQEKNMDFRDKVNFGTKLRKDENVQIIRKGM